MSYKTKFIVLLSVQFQMRDLRPARQNSFETGLPARWRKYIQNKEIFYSFDKMFPLDGCNKYLDTTIKGNLLSEEVALIVNFNSQIFLLHWQCYWFADGTTVLHNQPLLYAVYMIRMPTLNCSDTFLVLVIILNERRGRGNVLKSIRNKRNTNTYSHIWTLKRSYKFIPLQIKSLIMLSTGKSW